MIDLLEKICGTLLVLGFTIVLIGGLIEGLILERPPGPITITGMIGIGCGVLLGIPLVLCQIWK